MTNTSVKELQELINQGHTYKDVGEKFDIPPQTIWAWLNPERHRNQCREAHRRHYKKYPERCIKAVMNYIEKHPENVRKWGKIYYERHREKLIEKITKYQKDNPEKSRRWKENWLKANPEKRMGIEHKRRGLGFKPINSKFEGDHGHHVSKEYVVFIPAELHNSVQHNIFTGKGMERINELAFRLIMDRGFS